MDDDQGEFDFEDLEEREPDICRNKHGGEYFSEEANRKATPHKAEQREKVIQYLKTVPDTTTEEAALALHIPYTAASARMSELKRDGVITQVFIGAERAYRVTSHGKNAGVWRLVRMGPPNDSAHEQPRPSASTPGVSPPA